MIASILIIAISVLLFCYWFRYTCSLILSTRTTKDYTAEVAVANQLRFIQVQQTLRGAEGASLAKLQGMLDRDYRMITYLLNHAAELEVDGANLEDLMLRLNYQGMKVWYTLASRVSESAARKALSEMSEIVGHFANAFGERAATGARA